jgi:hypothetical protein
VEVKVFIRHRRTKALMKVLMEEVLEVKKILLFEEYPQSGGGGY